MSFSPKPCLHCGGTSFHVVPNIQTQLWRGTTALGMQAHQKMNVWWTYTLVLCTRCARTDVFTVNAAEMTQGIEGSYVAHASG
jgi:hypothetical protein